MPVFKHVFSVFAFSAFLLLWNATPLFAAAQADVFDDNVETETVGNTPSQWGTQGSPTRSVSDTPPTATPDGSKCIRIVRSGGTEGIVTNGNPNLSSNYVVELLVLKVNTNTTTEIALQSNTNTDLARIRFANNGYFQYYSSGSFNNSQAFAANIWYRVRILVDKSGASDTHSVWLDNDLIAGNLANSNTGNFGHLLVEVQSNNTNTTYIDDIEIYTHSKWTGGNSTAWTEAGNWSDGRVPGAGDTVRITDQSSQAFNPVLDATGAEWYNSGWTYRRKINLQASQVPNTDQNNFPVLINLTQSYLRSQGSGGKVGQTDGGDILFTSNDGTTKLSHHIEKYVNTSGELVAWVKVPVLSTSSNTAIYVYYGNSGASDQWETDGSTWDANYLAALHLNEAPANGNAGHIDFTSNSNNGTPNNFNDITASTDAAGKIAGADDFNLLSTSYVNIAPDATLNTNSDISISFWFKLDLGFNNLSALSQILWEKYLDGNNDAVIALVGLDYNSGTPADGSLVFKAEGGGGSASYTYTNTTSWTAGAWYHVTVILDASTNANNKIYVNGVDDTASAQAGSSTLNFNADMNLGGVNADQIAIAYFDGIIDEFSVSNIIRSSDWIQTLYNNQNTPGSFHIFSTEETEITQDPGGITITSLLIDDTNLGPNNALLSCGAQTLNISGNVEIESGGTLAVESGNLNLTGAGATFTLTGTLTSATGIIDVNGTLDATGGTFTFTSGGSLNLGGTVSSLGTFTPSISTVTYDGSANQTVRAVTYYNLIIDNGAAATATFQSGTITVLNNLHIFDQDSDLAANAGQTINVGGDFINNGDFTASTSTISLNSSSKNQTLNPVASGNTVSFYNLTIANTFGSVTVPGTGTLRLLTNGTLTIFGSSVLDLNGNCDLSATGVNLSFSGGGANGTLKLGGALTSNAIIGAGGALTEANGTIQFDNTNAAQTLPAETYNNIVVAATGQTVTAGGSIVINGTLTLSSGSLATGANTVTVTGTVDIDGTLNIGNGILDCSGSFDATGANLQFTGSGSLRLAGTVSSLGTFSAGSGTVQYDGTNAQSIRPVSYCNLIINKGGGSTGTAGGALTCSGNLTVTSGIFAPAGFAVNVGGTLTLNGNTDLGATSSQITTGALNIGGSGVLDLGTSNGLVTVNGTATNAGSIDLSGGGTLEIKGTFADSSGSITNGNGFLKFNSGAPAGTLINERNGSGLNIELATAGTSVEFNTSNFNTLVLAPGTWMVSDTHDNVPNDYRFYAGTSMNWSSPSAYPTDNDDDVRIQQGTVELSSTAQADTILVFGGFEMQSGAILQLDETLSVEDGGSWSASGATKPQVTEVGSGTGYTIEVKSGALVNINGLVIDNPDGADNSTTHDSGILIRDGASISALNQINFQNGSGSQTKYLRLEVTTGNFEFEVCDFDANCAKNVSTASTAIAITMTGAKGAKGQSPAGEANDHNDSDTADDSPNIIVWNDFKTWTGAVDTDWDTAGNWSPAGKPGQNDSVIIPNVANDPTLSAIATEASCKTLRITTGSLALVNKQLNVYGNVLIESGTLNAGTGTIAIRGAVDQSINVNGQTLNHVLINKTGGTVTASGVMDINGNFSLIAGAFNPGAFSHSVQGNWTETGGAIFQPTAGTLTFDGNDASTITTAPGNRFYNLSIAAGAANELTANSDIDVDGDFILGASASFVPGVFHHSIAGDFNVSAGNFHASAGTLTLNGGSPDISVHDSNSSLFNFVINVSGTAIAQNGRLNIGGNFSILSGTFHPGTGAESDHSIAGNWDDSGGAFAPGEGSITLTGASATIKTGEGNNFFDLIINSSATKSLSASSAPLRIFGDFDLESGALDSAGIDIHAHGNWDDSAGIFVPTAGTVIFSGTGSNTIYAGASNHFCNLTAQKSSGVLNVDAALNDLDIKGDFILQSGVFNASGNLDQLELGGNYILNGGTFTTSGEHWILNGSGSQSVDTLTIEELDIAKPSGSVILAGDLTINSNAQMNAGSNGALNLGTRTMTVFGDFTVEAGNSLLMTGSCSLLLGSGSSVTVAGSFQASGVTPTITHVSGNYSWVFEDGCSIDVTRLNFFHPDMGGMTIENGNNIVRLNSVNFQNIASGGDFLVIESFSGGFNKEFSGHRYDASFGGGHNISANSGGQNVVITMSAFGGTGAGELYDESLGSPSASIVWRNSKAWTGGWDKRKQITVNSVDAVPAGYTVKLTLNTSNAADFRADCYDLRIVYFNGSTHEELDRHVLNPGTASTTVWFKLQAAMGASSSDANYYLYYDNSTAPDPVPDLNEVYDFYDDFQSVSNWTDYPTGSTTFESQGGVFSARNVNNGEVIYMNDPAGKSFRSNSEGFICRCRGKQGDVGDDYLPIGWYYQLTPPGNMQRYAFDVKSGGAQSNRLREWTAPDSGGAIGASLSSPVPTVNQWYEYEVRVATDNTFDAYRDDVLIMSRNDTSLTSGYMWVGTEISNESAFWDWFLIRKWVSNEPSVTLGGSATDIAGKWSEPYNWSPLGIPSSAEDVIINGNYKNAPIVDAAAFGASLILGESASSSITFQADLTINSNVNIGAYGTINGTGSSNTITLSGDWLRQPGGTWTPGAMTVRFAGNPQVISAETWYNLIVDGDAITADSQTVQNNMLIENSRTCEMQAGTHSVGGTLTLDPGSTLKLGSSVMTVTGTTLVDSGSTLNLQTCLLTSNGPLDINGTLQMGSALLDVNNSFDATGATVDFQNMNGTLKLGGTVTSFGTLQEGNGTIWMDGTSPQTLPAETYHNLIADNSNASGLSLGGNITVSQTLTVDDLLKLSTFTLTAETVANNDSLNLQTGTLTVNNAYMDFGSLTAGAGSLLKFQSSASAVLTGEIIDSIDVGQNSHVECNSCSLTTVATDSTSWLVSATHGGASNTYRFYGTLNWNAPNTYDTSITDNVTIMNGTVTVDNDETIASLTVNAEYLQTAHTLTVTGAISTGTGGILDLRETATLKVGTSFTLNSGSTLMSSGSAKPTLTKAGAAKFSFTAESGSVLNLNGLNFDGPDANGMKIKSGATIVDIDNVSFKNGLPASTKYLKIEISSAESHDFSACFFDGNCLKNVSVPAGGAISITMTDASGIKGRDPDGEANDDDPDEPSNDIVWQYSVEWIGGFPGKETDWDEAGNWNPNIVPGPNTTVTIADKAFDPIINIATAWARTLTISTGILNLNGNTLEVNGNMTVSGSGALTHGNGTVKFKGISNQNINVTQTFYNLVLESASTVTAQSNLTTANDFTIVSGSFLPGTYTHSIAGSWDDTGGTFAPPAGTIRFTSAGADSIKTKAGNNFWNLTIDGSGANINMASGSTGLDVNGNLTLTNGALDLGTLTHKIAGNWDSSAAGATLNAATSTVSFDGASPTIKVKSANNSFNNMTVNVSNTLSMASGSTGLDINGNFTLNTGTFAAGSLTHAIAGNWDSSAAGTTLNAGTGTMKFDGSSSTIKVKPGNSFNHFTVNKTAGQTQSMASGSTGLDINGNFTLTTGSIDLGSLTHSIAGNWDSSVAGHSVIGSASTLVFDGAGSTINVHATDTVFNNVGINPGAGNTVSMAAASAGITANNFTISSGSWDPKDMNHSINGNWDDFAASSFTGGTGGITLTGASSTLKTKSGHSFNNLTLNLNSAGSAISMASGSAGIDVNGNFLITQGTFSPGAVTTHKCAGNWTAANANANFTGDASAVTFDGSGTQIINMRPGNKFQIITINSTGILNLDATNNVLESDGDFSLILGTFNGNGSLTNLKVGGDFTLSGGTFNADTSTVTFDGGGDQSIGAASFYNVDIANSSDLESEEVSLTGNWTVQGDLTVSDGALLIGDAKTATVNMDITVASGATLALNGNATLKIANGKVIDINGVFKADGVTPTLTTSGTVGSDSYTFNVNAGGNIDVSSLNFKSSANTGLIIKAGAVISQIDNVAFQNLAGITPIALDFRENGASGAVSYTLSGCSFDSTCSTNVKVTNNPSGSFVINMILWSGARAGESFDSETGSGTVNWAIAITWQGDDLSNPSFWSDTDNWDLGRLPLSTDTVIIPNAASGNFPVLNSGQPATTTIGALEVRSGATLSLTVAGKALTSNSSILVEFGGTLNGGSNTITCSSNLNVSGTIIVGTSTLVMANTTPAVMTGNFSLYNLTISGGSVVQLNGNITIENDLNLNASNTMTGVPGKTLVIKHDFIWQGSYSSITEHTIAFEGTGASSLSGATVKARDLYNLRINKTGGGSWSYTAGFTASSATNNFSIANHFHLLAGTLTFGTNHWVEMHRSADWEGGAFTNQSNTVIVGANNDFGSWRTDISPTFSTFEKQGTGVFRLQALSTATPNFGTCAVSNGMLELAHEARGAVTVSATAALRLSPGAALEMNGNLQVNGMLEALGTGDQRVAIRSSDATKRAVNIGIAAVLRLENLDLSDLTNPGLNLAPLVTGTIQSFHDIVFDNFESGTNSSHLDLSGLGLLRFSPEMRSGNLVFLDNITFDNAGSATDFNAKATMTTVKTKFRNFSGILGGESFDNDPFNRLSWGQGQVKNLDSLELFDSVQDAVDAALSGETITALDSDVHAEYVHLKSGVALRDVYLTPPPGGQSKDVLTGVMDDDWAINVVVLGGNIRRVENVVNCTVDGFVFGGLDLENNIVVDAHQGISHEDWASSFMWHLDNNAIDSSAASLNGTVTGAGFVSSSQRFGSHALSFDGEDDYISASLPPLAQQYSFSGWIKPDAAGLGYGRIFGRGDSWYLEYDYAGNQLRYSQQTNASMVTDTHSFNMETAWHHVAMTYDGETLSLYLDGALVASQNQNGQPANNGSFRLGSKDDNTRDFKGLMDELAMYRRCLSATEVEDQALAAASISPTNYQNYPTNQFFSYALGDFHLKLGAPGIDAGDNTLWDGALDPDDDFDSLPRIVNETVDLGAFEFQGEGSEPNWGGDSVLGGVNDVILNIVNNVIYLSIDSTGPAGIQNRVVAINTSSGATPGQIAYDSPDLGGSVDKLFLGRINGSETWIVATVDSDEDGNTDSLAFLLDTGSDLVWNTSITPGSELLFPNNGGLSNTADPGLTGPLGKAIVIAEGSGTEFCYVVNADNGTTMNVVAKYNLTTFAAEWINADETHDVSAVPAFFNAAYYGGAAGGFGNLVRVTSTSGVSTIQTLGASAQISVPVFGKSVSGGQRIFVAPDDNFLYRLDAGNLNIDWTSADLGGQTTGGLISSNSGLGSTSMFTGADSKAWRLKLTDGAVETLENWTGGIAINGDISSNLVIRGSFVYFGTNYGWCYALKITDGTATVAGYPYRITGGGSIKTVGYNAADNEVYFITQEGKLFALQPGS